MGLVFVVMAVSVLTGRPATAEDKLAIVKISVPQLDVFADDKGTAKVQVVDRSALPLPLDVLAKSATGRLKVRLPGGREGWIDGAWVTTSAASAPVKCDPGRTVVAGATRGSGAGCK
jgi:hypothetical protein